MTIRELTYRPGQPLGRHLSDRYSSGGGLPWYRETSCKPTKEEAFSDAQAWARDYEARDRYGNMASALGVVSDPAGGWRGVVNYYHSNT